MTSQVRPRGFCFEAPRRHLAPWLLALISLLSTSCLLVAGTAVKQLPPPPSSPVAIPNPPPQSPSTSKNATAVTNSFKSAKSVKSSPPPPIKPITPTKTAATTKPKSPPPPPPAQTRLPPPPPAQAPTPPHPAERTATTQGLGGFFFKPPPPRKSATPTLPQTPPPGPPKPLKLKNLSPALLECIPGQTEGYQCRSCDQQVSGEDNCYCLGDQCLTYCKVSRTPACKSCFNFDGSGCLCNRDGQYCSVACYEPGGYQRSCKRCSDAKNNPCLCTGNFLGCQDFCFFAANAGKSCRCADGGFGCSCKYNVALARSTCSR